MNNLPYNKHRSFRYIRRKSGITFIFLFILIQRNHTNDYMFNVLSILNATIKDNKQVKTVLNISKISYFGKMSHILLFFIPGGYFFYDYCTAVNCTEI